MSRQRNLRIPVRFTVVWAIYFARSAPLADLSAWLAAAAADQHTGCAAGSGTVPAPLRTGNPAAARPQGPPPSGTPARSERCAGAPRAPHSVFGLQKKQCSCTCLAIAKPLQSHSEPKRESVERFAFDPGSQSAQIGANCFQPIT